MATLKHGELYSVLQGHKPVVYSVTQITLLSLQSWLCSPTFPSLHLRHNSFSNPSVVLHSSQLILQPFFRLSYVTGFSLTSPGEPPMMIRSKNSSPTSWYIPVQKYQFLLRFALYENKQCGFLTPVFPTVLDCLFNIFAAIFHIQRPSPLFAT